MSKPYSIKIFVPAGNPDGVRTIEKSNRSGAGIVVPRSSEPIQRVVAALPAPDIREDG